MITSYILHILTKSVIYILLLSQNVFVTLILSILIFKALNYFNKSAFFINIVVFLV